MAMPGSGLKATQQAVVPPEMQGRYFNINQSVFSATGPLALIMTGPLADVFGVRPLCFAATAGVLLIALLRRFVPSIYYMEDHPEVGRSADE